MQLKNLLLIGALGLALTTVQAPRPANAQVTKSGPGYLLRIKWVKGQVMKYNITMSGSMMPKPQVISSIMTVKDVKNGIATVESKVTMPSTGSSRNTKPQVSTMKIDSRGKVIGESNGSLTGAATPTFPQGPVKIGQSWKGDMSVSQGMNLNATYTLISVKTVNGKMIAEVGQRVTGSMGEMGSMAGNGKVEIYGTDGSVRGGNMAMSLTMKSSDSKSQPSKMNFTTKITRV
ncbi:MAG: hypothetical protein JNK63_07315 [Chthonomonas sp.]|nr:hypothetical protein [Chthonomonas sp.]